MKSAGGMRVPDEDELPPLPSPDMAQIHLEGFCPLRVPMRDCEALLRDLRKWKNKHARAMDMNSDVVPESFKAVVAARKCVLLTAAVNDLYLRIRQQLSFFNHSKARSSPKKTAALQQKIREGTLSIRQASSQCGLRAVDALNVLVGKKSKRAQLRRHQTALLNALHQQREMHLDLARRTGEKPGWHAYNAAQKAKELAAVIQDNDKVFKEVDAVNDSVANAGDSGEELILSVLLEKCGVKRDDFWTEAELKAQNAAALKEGRERPYLKTPDFLFKKTVSINGRCVRWIDSKNNLIVPGVTIPPQITKYKRQINAYVDSFGPGMVLWHFCFFQSTQKLYSKPEMVFELSVPEAKEKAIAAGKAMYKRGVSIPCPLARAVIEAALEKDKQLTLEQLQTHEGAPDAAEATAP